MARLLCLALAILAWLGLAEETCEAQGHSGAVLAQLRIHRSCDLSALKRVTLLVHCRQSKEICELRRPLLMSYEPFFLEVRWLLAWPTEEIQLRDQEHLCQDPGDPYLCVAKVAKMLEPNAASVGLLYMHFDAVLAPCAFVQRFNPAKLGTFGLEAQLDWRTFQHMDQCNDPFAHLDCEWKVWSRSKAAFLASVAELQQEYPQLSAVSVGCWVGFEDFFYLPRRGFQAYGHLAEIFARGQPRPAHHEIVGPTILALTRKLSGLELQDFRCALGVQEPLTVQQVTSPDFACGHEVHYQDDGIVEAVAAILAPLNMSNPLGSQTESKLAPTEDSTHTDSTTQLPGGDRLDWSIWGELPTAGLGMLASLFLWLQAEMPKVLLSYLVCVVYVFISVVIDLSMAVQSELSQQDYSFEPMCAVFLTELIKLVISLCLALHELRAHGHAAAPARQCLPSTADVRWLSVPALIFTVNNILVWWAIGSNDMSAFAVFRDTMILWTAFLWRMVFGTALGSARLIAIGLVAVGLVLNQLENLLQSALSLSLALVLMMTACNALGSVINEFALKRNDLNINVQNAVLYAVSVLCTAALMMLSGKCAELYHLGFFHGFTRHTFFTVIMQALAGLTVSRILKYSDAVQKNIAACLRGPILVVISPLFVTTNTGVLTLVSAAIVGTGCGIYLYQGPICPSGKDG